MPHTHPSGRASRSSSARSSASPARRSRATRGIAARARCRSTACLMLSCITLAHNVDGEITTIEGLRDHPLVERIRRGRRGAVRVLHARPGRIRRGARRCDARLRPSTRSGIGWPETSAAAARIRESRRRSRNGEADPHREGGRGPLRGGLARRRGGSARAVAGRAAGRRRPRRPCARTGSSAFAARPATRRTSSSRGCSRPPCSARRTHMRG